MRNQSQWKGKERGTGRGGKGSTPERMEKADVEERTGGMEGRRMKEGKEEERVSK